MCGSLHDKCAVFPFKMGTLVSLELHYTNNLKREKEKLTHKGSHQWNYKSLSQESLGQLKFTRFGISLHLLILNQISRRIFYCVITFSIFKS